MERPDGKPSTETFPCGPIVSMITYNGQLLVATADGVYRLRDADTHDWERLAFVQVEPE